MTAGGRLRVAQDEVRTLDERGLWLRIGSVARILGTMLEGAGLTVASGGEVNLAITDLFLADPMAEAPPLDRARARLTLGVSETRGQLLAGPGPTNYRVDPGRIALFIDGARDTIEVAGRIDALITGDARIATQIDTTLSGLLGQIGGKAQPATSTGQGLRITMTEVGRWLAAVLPADAPVRVENSGQVTIALGGLAIAPSPARPAGPSLGKAPATPDILHRITASLEVGASGLRFAPTLQPETPGAAPPAPEMIEVGSFAITAGLSPAAAPSLTLDSAYTVSAQQFKIGGTLAWPARSPASRRCARWFRGRIALDQAPSSCSASCPWRSRAAGEPVNITALVGEAVGRKIDVVLGLLAPPRNQPADHTNVALRIIGRGTRLDASGVINAEGFAAGETVLAATLTPRLLQLVQNAFAPDLEHKPRLTENASVRITVAPMLIPLDESLAPRPRRDRADPGGDRVGDDDRQPRARLRRGRSADQRRAGAGRGPPRDGVAPDRAGRGQRLCAGADVGRVRPRRSPPGQGRCEAVRSQRHGRDRCGDGRPSDAHRARSGLARRGDRPAGAHLRRARPPRRGCGDLLR